MMASTSTKPQAFHGGIADGPRETYQGHSAEQSQGRWICPAGICPPDRMYNPCPTVQDVITVRDMITRAGALPLEIVNRILDYAEYWVCEDFRFVKRDEADWSGYDIEPLWGCYLMRTKPLGLTAWSEPQTGRWRQPSRPQPMQQEYPVQFLQRFTEGPKPTLEHPYRKFVFEIDCSLHSYWTVDHDGWGWTWYSAGLERFNASDGGDSSGENNGESKAPVLILGYDNLGTILPQLAADGRGYDHSSLPEEEEHRIIFDDNLWPLYTCRATWRWNDKRSFLRDVKLGDIITIWGHHRLRASMNPIYRAILKVYWAL